MKYRRKGKSPGGSGPQVTQRDIQILRFIGSEDEITVEMIRERFFPGGRNHQHYRRLRILRGLGLLKYRRYDWPSSGWGYALTSKGKALAQSSGVQYPVTQLQGSGQAELKSERPMR